MVDMEATQMKRKMLISPSERTFIVSALMAYDAGGVAEDFNRRFEASQPSDPTDDGPEISILDRNHEFRGGSAILGFSGETSRNISIQHRRRERGTIMWFLSFLLLVWGIYLLLTPYKSR